MREPPSGRSRESVPRVTHALWLPSSLRAVGRSLSASSRALTSSAARSLNAATALVAKRHSFARSLFCAGETCISTQQKAAVTQIWLRLDQCHDLAGTLVTAQHAEGPLCRVTAALGGGGRWGAMCRYKCTLREARHAFMHAKNGEQSSSAVPGSRAWRRAACRG